MEAYESIVYLFLAVVVICNLPAKRVNKIFGCDKGE
jgi:hypothetical protein